MVRFRQGVLKVVHQRLFGRRGGVSAAIMASVLLIACQQAGGGDELEQAKAAIAAKDPVTAQIHLKNLLGKTPSNGEARVLLGQTLLDSGDPRAAIIELRRAIELKADANIATPALATALFRAGESKLVVQQLANARLDSVDAQAGLQAVVSLAYLVLGQLDKADELAQQATKTAPKSPQARMALARVRVAQGKSAEALALAQAITADQPAFDEAWSLQGTLLDRAGDKAAALSAFQRAIGANPRQLDALYATALIHLADGNAAATEESFKRLEAAWPANPNTLYLRARLNHRDAKYELARQQYAALLNLAPENVPTLIAAGLNELKMEAPLQAEAMLARAVSLAPQEPSARMLLAQAQLQLGRPEKATAALEPLLKQAQVPARVLATAAQARLLQGDLAGADALFARAERLNPEDPQIRTALAVARLSRGGDAEPALRELRAISESVPGTEADFRIVSAELARKNTQEALAAIVRLEKKAPNDPAVQHLRGQALSMSGDASGARAAYERALAKNRTYIPSLAAVTWLDHAEGRSDAAKQRLEAATDPKRDNSHLLSLQAALAARTGAPSGAVLTLLDRAVKADPQNVDAWVALLTRHYHAADYSAAVAASQQATRAVPDNVQVMELTGRIQLAAGNINQANSTFADLIKVAPRSAAGYVGLITTLLASNDTANAAKVAQRLIDADPSSVTARRMAGDIEVRRNNPAAALSFARDLQKRAPEEAAGYLLEAQAASAQGNRASTIAALRTAVRKLNPMDAPVLLHTELLRAGQAEQATEFARSWMAKYPKDALYLTYLGDAAMHVKDFEGASAWYEKALAIDPRLVPALNNAALALMRRNDARAIEYAQRAVAVQPLNPDVLDTLAQVYAQRRAYPKAIDALKLAVGRATNPGPLQLSLARLHEAAGDRASAMAELQSVVDKGRTHPQYAEARKMQAALRQR